MIRKVLKANEKMLPKSGESIIPVIFDGPLDGQKIHSILDSLRKIKKEKSWKQIKCLFECPDLDSIDPYTLTELGKVHVNNAPISDKAIFEKWVEDLPLNVEETTYIKSLYPAM